MSPRREWGTARAKVLEPEAGSRQVYQLAVQLSPQYAAAADLVKATGGLPLALDQAGAYIEETQCGLQAYLELFHTRRATLLQQRGEGSRDHPESVSTTFTLAIAATAQRHPAVLDLLRVCALLQPEAIPEELFRRGSEHLGATLEVISHDELEWNQVVAVACSYSLLNRQPEERTLSIHRLVQAILLDSMTEEEQQMWNRRVIETLDAVFPNAVLATAYASWQQCQRLQLHTLLCLQRTDEETLVLASLAYKVAQYLRVRGQYAQAEPLFQRTLHIGERVLEPDHPEVARALNGLGGIYRAQGKYVQAESFYQRALSIREHVLGLDHPEVATSLMVSMS